jgi:hypothetical protein
LKRILLLLAALGAGVGTFFLVRSLREPGVDPGISHPSGGADAGVAGGGAGATRPADRTGDTKTAPILPTPPLPGGGDDVATPPTPPGGRSYAFEQEQRDPAWADEHERELTLRMRRLVDDLSKRGSNVDVDAIECRRSLCRVSLHAKDVPALSALYGALESEQGLYGWADNILLASVEAASDGEVKTSVTAVFERD